MTATRSAVLLVGAVTLLTGALRLGGLSEPREKVFDEVYYASDACWYAGHEPEECGLDADAERSWVHPPLGKQIIAMGIDAFGNRPLGWRVTAAVAGTATVALAGALAFLLFGSALWAGAGALLVATEHLLFVQSRVAMLDVFLTLFVVLGFVVLVADRRLVDAALERHRPLDATPLEPGTPQPPRLPARGWRPLELLAGAAFGAAVAVKWSGILALAGAVILSLAWERTRQRSLGEEHPLLRAVYRDGLRLYLALVMVPLAVYLLPWIPWLADRSFDLQELARHHGDMAGYHFGLDTLNDSGEPIHPYMSRAWSWLLLLRPVAYYWQGDPECCREIIGIGHPLIFWSGLVVVPYLLLVWIQRREWQAGALLVPILAQFLPWLVVSRPLFMFYMTPVTPFLALALVVPLRDLLAARAPRALAVAAAAVVVAVGVATFAFFLPVLTGTHLSSEAWRARMWFNGWV